MINASGLAMMEIIGETSSTGKLRLMLKSGISNSIPTVFSGGDSIFPCWLYSIIKITPLCIKYNCTSRTCIRKRTLRKDVARTRQIEWRTAGHVVRPDHKHLCLAILRNLGRCIRDFMTCHWYLFILWDITLIGYIYLIVTRDYA